MLGSKVNRQRGSLNRLHSLYLILISIGHEEFRIPFSLERVPVGHKFVARETEMTQMEAVLLPRSKAGVRRTVFVLYGLGGIGKTQLSVEFARKHQAKYSAIFWIDGSSSNSVKSSIAEVGRKLPQGQLREISKEYLKGQSTDLDAIVRDVLDWLSRPKNSQWLLILDNVDREYGGQVPDTEAFDVQKTFPSADHGYILITSRLLSFQRLGEAVKLKPVNVGEGAAMLESQIGHHVDGRTITIPNYYIHIRLSNGDFLQAYSSSQSSWMVFR